MRIETTLVGLLSFVVAAAADDAKLETFLPSEALERDKVRRRLKMDKSGEMSKKKDRDRFNGGQGDYQYTTIPQPSAPEYGQPSAPGYGTPSPPGYHPDSPPPYSYGKGTGDISRKKKIYSRSGHDRLMNTKSAKSRVKSASKGKGWTYPPNPSPTPPTNGTPAPTNPDACMSAIANSIVNQVSQVFTRNPSRCCIGNPHTAVLVTHAEPDSSTFSGFEPFWDAVYLEILETTNAMGVCFVMTGYDAGAGTAELSQVILETLGVASTIPEVPSIMATDPTTDVALMQAIRSISRNSLLSSIGVFNAGYNNLVVEAIVSGQDRLPYVGYLSDSEFGTEAGRVSLRLLDGTPAVPLCYNARIGVSSAVAERCASFYAEVTSESIQPEEGVACSSESSPQELANQIMAIGANVVWTHVDCCVAVSAAVTIARGQGMSIIVGCQDIDTTGGDIDFVTQQPIQLQAYQAAAMASFPVIQAGKGNDGRGEQFFPSLQTLVNTGIFSTILL